jgi:hypothetical protein
MGSSLRCLLVAAVMGGAVITMPSEAQAQVPIAVAPAVPAVVGYTAERRGLFGQRVVFRPVVAPVATAVPVTTFAPTVTVARPVVTVARPVVTVARPVVTVPTPVVSQRVVVGFAPPVTPVTSFFAPPVAVPVAAPVTTFRVPVVSVVGF